MKTAIVISIVIVLGMVVALGINSMDVIKRTQDTVGDGVEPQKVTIENEEVSLNCVSNSDCKLINKDLGFGCCWAGACESIDYSLDKYTSVNSESFDALREANCPSAEECGGVAPGCLSKPLDDSFEAKCVQNVCQKVEKDKVEGSGPLNYFIEQMSDEVISKVGQPFEGISPRGYKQAFPGLLDEDFDGVEAIGGSYVIEDGEAKYVADNPGGLATSADGSVSNEGMETLLNNIANRLDIEVKDKGSVDEIIGELKGKLRACPDGWIDNRMPQGIGEGEEPKYTSEYFIVNGERAELEDYDVSWVEANCNLEKQVVY